MKQKRNKIGQMLICGITVLGVLAGALPPETFLAAQTAQAAGAGENEAVHDENILEIGTVKDLEILRKNCTLDSWSSGKTVILTEDIDLTGSGFEPIPYFSGVFDGQGHSVTGMTDQGDGSVIGFFRYVGEGAIVRNLHVSGKNTPGGSACILGGIAGDNAGMILDCSFEGTVTGKRSVGGIAGINHESGVISGCTVQGEITAEHEAGGIAGQNGGRIASSRNDGAVNTSLVQTEEDMRNNLTSNLTSGLSNLSSFDLSSVNQEDFVDIMDIGGIAGWSEGTVSDCVNTGDVGYPHTGYNVGGVVGRSNGYLVNCQNEGFVQGRKDVGGIAGQLEPEAIWTFSQDKMDSLKEELTTLNGLIDQLFYDLAGGSDTLRNQVETASACAGETIDELSNLTDAVSEDLGDAAEQILSLVKQLKDAYRQENAQEIKTALNSLAQVLSETDFSKISLKADTDGSSDLDIGSVLNASGDAWWPALQAYLDGKSQETETKVVYLPGGDSAPILFGDGETFEDTGSQDGDTLFVDPALAGDDDPADLQDLQEEPAQDDILDPEEENDGLFFEEDEAGDFLQDPEIADDSITIDDSDELFAVEGAVTAPKQPVMAAFAVMKTSAPMMVSCSQEEPDPVIEEEQIGGAVELDSANEEGASAGADTGVDAGINAGQGAGVSMNVGNSSTADFTAQVDADVSLEVPNVDEIRALVTTILTNGSMLLDPEALENAAAVLDSLEWKAPDTEAFYESFGNLTNALAPLAGEASSLISTAAADIDAITNQMDVIMGTFFNLAGDISLEDAYQKEDISENEANQRDTAVIADCRNEGNAEADTNAGGITGSIAFENVIDAEDMLKISDYLLKEARYQIFSAVRSCRNTGSITAKKEAAGGIAGSMEFGFVTDSINAGAVTVTDGSYSGGIAGRSAGTISASCSGSLISGNTCVGGIAGEGDRITNCISYSYIGGGTEHLGAVAGQADGEVSGCKYVDYGYGGIDNIGYAGSAEPVQPEGTESPQELHEAESESITGTDEMPPMEELPPLMSTCRVTFIVNDEIYDEEEIPFGGAIDVLPEVANDGDNYWKWDDFEQKHIFKDMEVHGAYYRPVTTLAAGGDVPAYLAEGIFYEGQTLTVSDYTGEYPEPEDLRGKLEEKLAERLEAENRVSGTFHVNDYEGTLKARVKAVSGGTLFLNDASGVMKEAEYEKDGSYITFPVDNGGSFIYYAPLRPLEEHVHNRVIYIVAGCGGAAAIIILLIMLKRRKRKKR